MKILFVVNECQSYAVGLFSSLLKQRGHEVSLVFDPRIFETNDITNEKLTRLFDIRHENIKKIARIKPDLIGFSVYTKDYRWSLMMARLIKKELNVPIIFGGIHCTLVPEEVVGSEGIDIVCVGEGEFALLELVDSIQKGRVDYTIKNLWFRTKEGEVIKNEQRPLINDLDSLPFPDSDIFFEQKPIFAKGYMMNTGRGCPYQCTFCVSGSLNRDYLQKGLGRYVRQRSVNNTIAELVWAKNKYKYQFVTFTDDVFTMNVNWLRSFSEEYKRKIHIPFFCTANPGAISDEELMLLQGSNCQMIGFGLQSASEDTRINILHRKGQNKRIKEVAGLCHKLKLRFWFDHIFNIPGETVKEQVEALEFYNESRPDVINTFWMTYFPKTKITDLALEKGILDEETVKKVNRGEASTSLLGGVGCGYSFGKREMFEAFSFLFNALPLLPKWLVRLIVKKRWYRFRVSVPFLVRLAIKDLARFKIGRYMDVVFPIQLLFINMFDNLKVKFSSKA